ncbi:MnmC family methyltransferase [Bdellovibrio sp. SKB1291214]|uniref:MnmC family methyltransferase n=1 Tax=Bdellovibrio sp. SKB1291214 TaxID=1732569 RepID=UPI0020CE0670|nr:MnmC family methyltransferase [Bdellovibrio sp. SKB1291214]UYL08125.1 MnmC family methyltransferase [Bdellovibrio sp. SKB1291214]
MIEEKPLKSWEDIGFEIEITKDQSPTLRLLESLDPAKPYGESMHHSGGASTETTYLYGSVAATVLEKIKNPHFMVVGLGLGYIEMNLAREALKQNKTVGLITSYESIPELREFFYLWLHGKQDQLHQNVAKVYDEALRHVLIGTEITPQQLKSFLRDHFANLTDFHGALNEDVQFISRYHGIFYDAFSSKTHPHLWGEDFLNRLLLQSSAETSVLTTYALKSNLKRALRAQGFTVTEREGFFTKRGSTLGTRGYPEI